MGLSKASAELIVRKWRKRVAREYVRQNRFAFLMGEGVNDAIFLTKDLKKNEGEEITIPVVFSAKGDAKRGTQTLSGNESQIITAGDRVRVELVRNAWAVHKSDQQKSLVDLLEQVEPLAKDWEMVTLRDDLLTALLSTNLDGKTAHLDTLAADRNAWLAANLDRVLFGNERANSVSGVFATAAALVDSTNDRMKASTGRLAKRMMEETTKTQAIRPIKVDDDIEQVVCLVGPRGWRDLEGDSEMINAYQNAEKRGKDNRLFTGGEMYLNGIIYRQVPEIPSYTGIGASGIDVEPYLMLGAQAATVAWAEMPHEITEQRDYKAIQGVGVEETRGVKRIMYRGKMHGVVMGFVASTPDA